MQTEGQKELEAAHNSAEQGVDNLPESDQNDNVVESEVDESGAVEAAEYAGITEDVEGENTPPEDGTVDDGANDHRLSTEEPQSETVVQDDKYAQEVPITHLKSPVNKKVFEATPDLMKRKDLVPCDEDGKKVYDHRRL